MVNSRRNQEALIVYVPPPDSSKNVAVKFLSIKGAVYDKIKTDFNTSKKDRCCQLAVFDTDARDTDAWADLFSKMKDGIVSGFDQAVLAYEEELRKLDAQRMNPNWNYCFFFFIKVVCRLYWYIYSVSAQANVS